MKIYINFLFRQGAGYDILVTLIRANPRYIFTIWKQDRFDRRTKKSKERGWVEIRHDRHAGSIRLSKKPTICSALVTDKSNGQLIGAWISWLARNASDLVGGLDLQFLPEK